MKYTTGILVALCALAAACSGRGAMNSGSDGREPDGNSDGDADGDGDGDGDADGDGGSQPSSMPVLRKNIGIDLAAVSSFVALSGTGGSSRSLHIERAADGDPDAGASPGPRLLALTLSGETLEVSLVETSDSQNAGASQEPEIAGIYPTASWIIFSTPHFSVYQPGEDGGGESVDCAIIAANRSSGSLYCAPLRIAPLYDARFASVQANAAGDVAYAVVVDSEALDQGQPQSGGFSIYRITLDDQNGPDATLIYPSVYVADWFLVNAAGDMMVNYFPSVIDRSTTPTEILPVDGGSAYTLEGARDSFAACGEAGAADENRFYVTSGMPFDGTIVTVTWNGASFVETPQVVDLGTATPSYEGLYLLGDGIYMFSGDQKSLVRVISDGAVIPSPTPIAIEGVDQILQNLHGSSVNPAEGQLVFLAKTGTAYSFLRHDGTTSEQIPLGADIAVISSFTVAQTGAIDFLGIRAGTQEKLRGSIEAGATEVTINSAGVIDPAKVVAFTRVN